MSKRTINPQRGFSSIPICMNKTNCNIALMQVNANKTPIKELRGKDISLVIQYMPISSRAEVIKPHHKGLKEIFHP